MKIMVVSKVRAKVVEKVRTTQIKGKASTSPSDITVYAPALQKKLTPPE